MSSRDSIISFRYVECISKELKFLYICLLVFLRKLGGLKYKLYLDKSDVPLYVFVVAVFDLPRIIIEILNLPVPYYFGGNPPWFIPILLAVFLLNIILIAKRFNKFLPLDGVDILMVMTLVTWLLLYLYHSDYTGGGWKSWNGAYLITTHAWLFLALYILKSYSYFYDIRHKVVDVTINVLTGVSLFFLFLIVVDNVSHFSVYDQLKNRNGLALNSVFCLLLLLFFDSDRKITWKASVFIINFILILQTNSRAALLSFALLVIYKIYTHLFSDRLKPFVVVIFVVSWVILGVEFYHDILMYIDDMLLHFNVFGRAYSPSEGYGINNSVISAVSRIQSSVLLFFEYLKHPFLGIGYQNAMNVKSFGYISHTYYLFPLAAYGIVGVFPYLLMISLVLYRGLKYNREATIAASIFSIAIFTFLNDMVAWLAIVIFLIKSKPSGKICSSC